VTVPPLSLYWTLILRLVNPPTIPATADIYFGNQSTAFAKLISRDGGINNVNSANRPRVDAALIARYEVPVFKGNEHSRQQKPLTESAFSECLSRCIDRLFLPFSRPNRHNRSETLQSAPFRQWHRLSFFHPRTLSYYGNKTLAIYSCVKIPWIFAFIATAELDGISYASTSPSSINVAKE